MLLIMIDRRFLQDPINNIHDTPSTLYLDTQEYTYNEKQTSGDGCVMVQVHTLEEKDAHIRSLQQAIKSLQQTKDGLQQDLHQAKEDLKKAKDGLQQDLHQAKEDLKKAKEEVRSLTFLGNVSMTNPNLKFQIWIIVY